MAHPMITAVIGVITIWTMIFAIQNRYALNFAGVQETSGWSFPDPPNSLAQ